MDKLAATLGIKQPRDWYYVSIKQFNQHGGRGMLEYYRGSLTRALQAVYPDHHWHSHNTFVQKKRFSKTQYALLQHIQCVSNARCQSAYHAVTARLEHRIQLQLIITRNRW